MTEQELRKKIVEITISTVWKDCYGDEVVIDRVAAEQLADALIKANIGDLEELQFENSVLKQTNFFLKAGVMSTEEDRQVWIKKWKEEERKADVAEKALDLCETAYILSLNHRATEGISGQAIASDLGVHKFFMEQAEKELEGEKPIKTSDLSQCQSCAYHYTYEGQDMCRQVGDDFYLQWKMEDCPKYSSIGDVLCSEPVYRLKHELRSKIEYIHEQDEVIKEYKRRAEVAEKELLVYKEVAGAMLCEIGCSNEGYCPEFYKDPECKNCTKKKIYGNFAATSPCLLDKYIQQAEKELAEERKEC